MRGFRPNTAIFDIHEKKEKKTHVRAGNLVVSYFCETRKG
jgi:hypothetical protein